MTLAESVFFEHYLIAYNFEIKTDRKKIASSC